MAALAGGAQHHILAVHGAAGDHGKYPLILQGNAGAEGLGQTEHPHRHAVLGCVAGAQALCQLLAQGIAVADLGGQHRPHIVLRHPLALRLGAVDLHAGEIDHAQAVPLPCQRQHPPGALYRGEDGLHRLLHHGPAGRLAGGVNDIVHILLRQLQRGHIPLHQTEVGALDQLSAQHPLSLLLAAHQSQHLRGIVGLQAVVQKPVHHSRADQSGGAGDQNGLPVQLRPGERGL